ncbi:MAG TPA: right-handed parallel beta-helix repeat-containing protein [Anaerohalosphaeraceae bacterium]|nr:right-handed parallel beta-helix repeat-containing protein [Anaerohalosphaeraceae bacterium]
MSVFHRTFFSVCMILFFVCISWAQSNAVEFYLAPDGSNSNPGTREKPFQSLEKAKNAVRAQLKQVPGQTVVVNIKGGVYYLEAPVVFTAEDSGSKELPVVYRAVDGEKPIFTGSMELKNWQPLVDQGKLELLSPDVKGKIYQSDLKAAGIRDFGDPTDIGKRPDLYCSGQLQPLSRWPNQGFTTAGQVKGATSLPPTYANQRGTVEGIFEYTSPTQDRWAKESDVRLGGYWYWDWSDEYQKVDKVDKDVRTIYLRKPYHSYGYKDHLMYFGLNLFCEMDVPGEWYLDRTTGLLYWFVPEGINPNQAQATLSVFNAPFMVEMKDCSHLILQGLTFQEGRGSAMSIRNGDNCRIEDCRIERFGKDGIHIEAGSNHGITGCLLDMFGCGGIKMNGGDRKTLTPAGHFVENTVVEHFSLFKRTYEPAVHAAGCGIRISHNRFRFSSSSAMRLEGNDMLIEYNQVSHVVNESDDQGGIDMWYNPSYRGIVIRFNRWSDISGGTRHGAAGVRLDDMISGVLIHGNIFERCGTRDFGGVQIHGGKDNTVENNLFYHCHAAVSFSSWGEKRWLEHLESPAIQKKIYEDVDIRSELYQNKYPELKNIRLNADANIIKNNLLVDCKQDFLRRNDKQVVENNPGIQAEGKTLEQIAETEVLKKYGLQPIPVAQIGIKANRWLER